MINLEDAQRSGLSSVMIRYNKMLSVTVIRVTKVTKVARLCCG